MKTKEEDFCFIEQELEQLSIQLIEIMQTYRSKGIISETEYYEQIKVKKEFLDHLEKKRSGVQSIS